MHAIKSTNQQPRGAKAMLLMVRPSWIPIARNLLWVCCGRYIFQHFLVVELLIEKVLQHLIGKR